VSGLHFSRDMLALATHGAAHLGGAGRRVGRFVRAQQGGAAPDLYYTMFEIDCLLALGEVPGRADADRLRGYGDGSALDTVHLACLSRCWSRWPDGVPEGVRGSVLRRAAACRAADGGFALEVGAPRSSMYAGFLLISALQDAGVADMRAAGLLPAVEGAHAGGGGYAEEPGRTAVATNATVAAILLHRAAGVRARARAVRWLRSQHRPGGGFGATPAAPLPDLVSTATALTALKAAGASFAALRDECLDFVEGLWDERGGFVGTAADTQADVEYTFHALLCFGCLTS